MFRFLPNTASQSIYLTLKERVKDLASFTNYLIELRNMASQEAYYIVANVATENDRYTKITLGTNTDDAVNGSIEITETGQFFYKVWGQNSTTNLDPDDAAVVGVAEIGMCLCVTQETFYNLQGGTIPAKVIYYE